MTPSRGGWQRTPSGVLHLMAEVAPPLIAQRCAPGPHCVMATAVGQLVLAQFHVVARAVPVELSIWNDAWAQWGKTNFAGGMAEQRRRGAYLLTNSPRWQGGSLPSKIPIKVPWDGHLVLMAGRTLIDLDLGAFARPDQRIFVPQAVVTAWREDLNGVSGEFTHEGTTTYVNYQPFVSPEADAYQQARDWVERDRYDDLVWEIARRIRGT